jgi:SagB-type dehydrogenase family enzyme
MTWREYHESTKHSVESLRHSNHRLDWANMPGPFRHYEGLPVLDLPADPPSPEIATLELLAGVPGATSASDGPAFLSQVLFYSAAVSASKRVASTGSRYALRVNPSSGNLHPTELHFFTRDLLGWPDGLYHYRPSSHMAEQRAFGSCELKVLDFDAPVVFVLASIAWREEWKYSDRAYRYCLHDIGHAWQALVLAANAMGCETAATGDFPDDEIAQAMFLADDEWPMLMIALQGQSIPVGGVLKGAPMTMNGFGGVPNKLSSQMVEYPMIESIHAATKLEGVRRCASGYERRPADENGEIELPAPSTSTRPFGEVARSRRSALDFKGGAASMTVAQLSAILAAATQPMSADFAVTPFVQLYLYAHRVDGLPPGLYRHEPASRTLEQIKSGDQRVIAAALSLRQDLAGNACAAFSMIGDLDRATRSHGDRGYRYVHFEAGAIGQRLYLAAEALGLGSTGIGAFFDDEVNRYLNLEQGRQVVYHFAIGYPIPDYRLEAQPG